MLLPVPAAEPAVGPHRARLDAAARDGVPAHLTVLYPFLPPDQVDDAVLAALGRLFAGFPAFAFTLDRVAWFGEQVVWLAPHDPAPFRAIMTATCAAYPDCPPYGGQHTEVIPHLTLGHLGTLAAFPLGRLGQVLLVDAGRREVRLVGAGGRAPVRRRAG